jgi:peptidoglycan hydrolase-like protein with peptidoglycan-binding domain
VKFILDTRLTNAQYTICTEAIRRGIIDPEDLNENKRTMREQWAFYRNQPPLAAYPSPRAPHIKSGRVNQAMDGNTHNGAIQRLADFYRSLDIPVSFNVPGEKWHMDVLSSSAVRRAAKKIRRQRDKAVLKRGEREKAVKFLKHQLHFIKDKDTKKVYYRPGETKPKDGWDDFFNPELEASVKQFQRDHNLRADGAVGPKTDKKIDRAYAKQKRKRKSAKARAAARKAAAESGTL